jgi:hypothetical protein
LELQLSPTSELAGVWRATPVPFFPIADVDG